MRPAEGGFHHQDVGVPRFARLCGQPAPKFEISRIEEGFIARGEQGHGAAENVSCREQCDLKWPTDAAEFRGFSKGKLVLQPFARQPGLH